MRAAYRGPQKGFSTVPTIIDFDPIARLCRESIRTAAENQRLRNLLLLNNINPDIDAEFALGSAADEQPQPWRRRR